VAANVVWYAVKRCAHQAGIANLARPPTFVPPVPDSAMTVPANSSRFSFWLDTLLSKQWRDTSEANRSFKMRLMIDLEFPSQATPLKTVVRAAGHEIGDSEQYR
jgi:hypothetical protein